MSIAMSYIPKESGRIFSIDTNLLVYAHNADSQFNKKSAAFLEQVLNERDEDGNLYVCLTAQVLMEFINVITRRNIGKPLSLPDSIRVINDYLETGIRVLSQFFFYLVPKLHLCFE